MALKRGEEIYALGSSCKKCKFPLFNGECNDEKGTVKCSVCGTMYSYKDGSMVGREAKQGVGGLFSDIMSSGPGGNIEAYEVRTAADGKVYAAVGSK